MRALATLLIWGWLGWHCFCSAQTAPPTLVKATTKDRQVVVGGLMGETDEEIRLFDLKKNEVVSLKKSDVISYRKNVSDSDAALSVGAWRLLTWKIKQCVPMEKPTGRVAEVDGDAVYVTLGAGNSVAKEDELLVFREGGEIKDPVTGDVLGTRRISVARLVVTDVRDKYSNAKTVGDKQMQPKVGDQVEPVRFNNAIAVLPPVDADGDETVGGKYFAEQLCAELVRNHVTVVERMLLGKAIDELVRQQGREFNEKTAEEIGKQVGAYAIATGSLLKRGNRIGARLRLIQVATGKVVMTSSLTLSARRFPELSAHQKVTSDRLAVDVPPPAPADVPPSTRNAPIRRPGRALRLPRSFRADQILKEDINDRRELHAAAGPYLLAARITVSKDAVLRIERGTTIYSGRDAMLTAIGKLETFGNDEELVQFRALLPAEPWDGIRLENPGELTVSGIDVRGARVGVHVVSGKQTVRDSIAAHNEIGVKILSPGSSGQRRPIKIRLRGCVIADNQRDGISVRGHRFGLDHCTITDNGGAGLRMTYYGYPEIKACVFARNEIGIASGVHSTRVEMSGSAVLLNRAAAIEVKSPEDFDCRGNFWGTKDPRFISATLRDGADNPGLGHVLFEPFETKPIKDAGSPLWDSVWVKEKASQRRRVRRR